MGDIPYKISQGIFAILVKVTTGPIFPLSLQGKGEVRRK